MSEVFWELLLIRRASPMPRPVEMLLLLLLGLSRQSQEAQALQPWLESCVKVAATAAGLTPDERTTSFKADAAVVAAADEMLHFDGLMARQFFSAARPLPPHLPSLIVRALSSLLLRTTSYCCCAAIQTGLHPLPPTVFALLLFPSPPCTEHVMQYGGRRRGMQLGDLWLMARGRCTVAAAAERPPLLAPCSWGAW